MANEWYRFFMLFDGKTPTYRGRILRHFSEETISEALANNYIEEVGRNTYNEILYQITELGKKIRDK